ncbi:MAG: class I SAM-dependent methyltransferase [Labilithrix sp.]|nr:class I SAM-dependent methyltransferase [Labilithrix sp.]MCW5813846.1 class I SAM-dependent methyltransferase [Labilithrix sp.]
MKHEETAVFETHVVPRYLSFFGERVLHKMVAGKDARVCHVRCRTGYPDRELIEKLPNAHVHGVDSSSHAIELARAKALALVEGRAGIAFDYRVGETLPLPFPAGVFSHAFTLHAPSERAARRAVVEELVRLVAPRGQVLVAMPLRGSFLAVHDLLRECALKHEIDGLSAAVDAAAAARPSDESLARELEDAGLDKVSVDVRTRTLRFEGGRRFFEDPVTRLVLLPELHAELGPAADPIGPLDPFVYVRDAIDKYWSDATFELDVNVGVAAGRKR